MRKYLIQVPSGGGTMIHAEGYRVVGGQLHFYINKPKASWWRGRIREYTTSYAAGQWQSVNREA